MALWTCKLFWYTLSEVDHHSKYDVLYYFLGFLLLNVDEDDMKMKKRRRR